MSLELPKALGPITTVLGAIDTEAGKTARVARDHGVAAVRRAMPVRSGKLRQGQRGTARRARDGYTIEVAPSSRVRYPNGVTAKEVTRWVEQGTGLYGPFGRVIRPRRGGHFHLPNGWANAVKGQRGQHIYLRVQTAEDARVARILQDGATAAAQAGAIALTGGTA